MTVCVECLESVGQVLRDEVLLEAEQTIELLMCLSNYQTQWRLSSSASLQLLMVLHCMFLTPATQYRCTLNTGVQSCTLNTGVYPLQVYTHVHSVQVYTRYRCTPVYSEYRCALSTSAHSVLVYIQYWCTLSTGVLWVQVYTRYRWALNAGVHSVELYT